MGLLNELNTINRTLENNQKQLTKSEIREKETFKKYLLQRMLQEDLHAEFCECNNSNDIEDLISELLKYKSQNISIIISNYNNKFDNKATKQDIYFLDKIYFKNIQEVKKEYLYIIKQNEKKKTLKLKQEEERQDNLRKKVIQQQHARQELLHGIAKVFYIIALILALPFLFLGLFIIGILKNVK